MVKDEVEGRQRPAKTRARLQGGPLSLHLLSCTLDLTVECGGAGGGLKTCNVMYVPGFDCSQEIEISGGLFEPSTF